MFVQKVVILGPLITFYELNAITLLLSNHVLTNISEENLRVNYYLQLQKYCRRQCTLLTPTWAKLLTKFKLKRLDFKRVLNLTCK